MARLLFAKEAKMDSAFPLPPTGKEMLEDLENCSRSDSAIEFGEIVHERVKSLSSDGSHPHPDSSLRAPKIPEQSSKTDETGTRPSIEELLDLPALIALKKMSLKIGNSAAPLKQQPSSTSENTDSVFMKLKKLSSECEKTQDLIAVLDPELKTLKSDTHDFKNSLIAECEEADNN